MGFSARQLIALRRNLDHSHVRTRQGSDGRELSYLEGWYAISEANRIFGFDSWSRETLDSKCVLARANRGTFLAVYTARVRITVRANETTVIREGHGTGEGRGTSPGEVHDVALKAAETDATKRALATFGKPFGLELYRRDKAGPALSGRSASPPTVPSPQAASASATPPPRHGFHPDDTTPIPRPSTYYGRDRYAAMREQANVNARQRVSSSTNTATKSTGSTIEKASEQQSVNGGTTGERQGTIEAPLVPTDVMPAPLVPSAIPDRLPGRIDKSVLAIAEPKRLRDKNHLKFVASQPCLICGRQPSDPHHLRFAQPHAIGMKVSDEFTVPLCRGHHRQLHQAGNEVAWWENLKINALEIAQGLRAESRAKKFTADALVPRKQTITDQSEAAPIQNASKLPNEAN